MVPSRLDIHRRNRGEGALVTLAGEIGPESTPLLRTALEQCLRDGVTVIDVDLTTVGSCDARGLNVFLSVSRRAGRVHASLQLHHPCAQITQLLAATGSTPLLLAARTDPVPPALPRGLLDTASPGPSADGASMPEGRARVPVLKDGIRLRRLTRWQTEGMGEDIADLDMASVAGTSGQSFHDRGEVLGRLAVSARRPGFALLVAETTVLVGCAYGYPVGPEGSGRRGFDRMLQASVQRLTACARFLVLTQIVARPHAQHRDIARLLQRRLLTDRHAAVGVALLHPADHGGQAVLESWGWQNMGEIVGLPGPVTPCVLILPLAGALPAGR
ncbi:STAS domain-containing protein [Streptomyces luteogriseus]|uniref:STAS domain-containing protein n=1 Tax=Streptomyces luteogriseus TaxID=68233 RepID=UPI002E36BF2E|nr:STAS domain-containing protein [Streptomyces luteogriseus]WTJ29905.1 STAS domain-containing protein [Streptomyces luteogriseus]